MRLLKFLHPSDLIWFVPLACLGLLSLAPLRPSPSFPPPANARLVTDAAGTKVAVPPEARAALKYGPTDFLEVTHAPALVARAGATMFRERFATGIVSKIYPEVLANESLWRGDDETIEAILAQDHGEVYFSGGEDLVNLRKLGLIALSQSSHPRTRDAYLESETSVTNAALGQPELGSQLYARYQIAFAALARDLNPGPDLERPSVLGMGSSRTDWRYIWVGSPETSRYEQEEERVWDRNASDGLSAKGRQQDSERILLMDPDFIFVSGETPAEFQQDRRWAGLKAVAAHHVYLGVRDLRTSMVGVSGLDFGPVWARWKAELLHPERLSPQTRAALTRHFHQEYGYQLTEDVLDDLLRVSENAQSADYARFLASSPSGAAP